MSEEESQVYENGAELSEEEVEGFAEVAAEYAEDVSIEELVEPDEVQAAGEEELKTASAYRVVNLIGRFTSANGNWGVTTKDYGTVDHWNGSATPERAWREPIAWIKFINDLHAKPGRFARGWTFDGCAYHEFAILDVIYRVRAYGADLPHCGNLAWNRRSLALHVPIGQGQVAADSTHRTLTARRRDHLAAMRLGRNSAKSHGEVGPSECSGPHLREALRRFRAGQNPGGGGGNPSPPPEKSPPPTGTMTRYEWCQDASAPAPMTLTWDGRPAWRVTRVQSGRSRSGRRMSRWAWCQDASAPAPVILTYQGKDEWEVRRL